MHIHIQNEAGDELFPITATQFQEAALRAGLDPAGFTLSFGTTDAEFAVGIATAEALIAIPGQVRGRFPCAAPALKLIFCPSAGLDKLMPLAWLPPGVAILNNRGTHAGKAVEYAAMALLMLNARVPTMLDNQRAKAWTAVYSPTLRGRRVTVVGTGTLGSATARAARMFGATVTGVRRQPGTHPDFDQVVTTALLDSVLQITDFLVLACPLTEETRNLLNRDRLGLLPKGASLVNIGRGGLVDQAALCDALESGHLAGAVLDVATPEPLPPEDRLWTTPNVVITPHVAVDDPLTYNPISLDIFLANLTAWRAGEPMPNQVDPARGY